MSKPWVTLVLLTSCGTTPTSPPKDSATTPTEPGLCAAEITSSIPEDRTTDVFYRTAVAIELSEAVPTATLTVSEVAGAAVAGQSVVDGAFVRWTGDPLAPNTAYQAVVSDGCGSDQITFHTSSTGETADDVVGRVYALDLTTGQWIAPPNFGEVLPSLAGEYGMLVSPTAASPTQLSMLAAVTKDGVQNTCAPTIPLADAAYTNPFFELMVPQFPVTLPAETLYITDFALSGAFVPDGSALDGVALSGLLDTRPLANLLLGNKDGCPALLALGVTCEACPDGAGDYCVAVEVEGVRAEEIAGVMVEILEPDPSCGAD